MPDERDKDVPSLPGMSGLSVSEMLAEMAEQDLSFSQYAHAHDLEPAACKASLEWAAEDIRRNHDQSTMRKAKEIVDRICSVECPECDGQKEFECPSCDGAGDFPVSGEGGDERVPCGDCGESGYYDCSACGGLGRVDYVETEDGPSGIHVELTQEMLARISDDEYDCLQ